MKDNYDSYKKLNEFCIKNDFEYLATTNIFAMNNGDCSTKKLALNQKKLKNILPDIDKIRGFHKNKINAENPICNSIKYSIAIDCKGKVYPCNNLPYAIGDIFTSNIYDIWCNSEKLKKLKNLKWKDLKYCLTCEQKEYCIRCTGIALLEEKNLLERDTYECIHAKLRYENAKVRK